MRSKCKKDTTLCWDVQFFRTIVQPTVLCGLEIQKHFLLEEFKVKQLTQYDIMLLEADLMPLEVEAICQFVAFAQHLANSAIDNLSKLIPIFASIPISHSLVGSPFYTSPPPIGFL
ncbi:hypothetical protein AMTRI_Chr03g51630 [Amborella trichopoda]